MRTLRVVVIAMVVVVWAGGVLAAPEDQKRAKEIYIEGQRSFDLGDFPRAVELFKQAYDLSGREAMLFNIAQSYRRGGNPEQALFFYETYLRKVPAAPNRIEVEGFIEQMRAAVEARKAQPEPTKEPDKVPDPTPDPGPTKIPSPVDAAAAVTPEPAPAEVPEDSGRASPIYKKWWFWAGIGAVAAGTVAVVFLTGSDGNQAPDADHDNVITF